MNDEKWVEDRLALLTDGSHSLPDAHGVLGKLQSRKQASKTRRNRLVLIGVPCLIGCVATAAIITIRPKPRPAPSSINSQSPNQGTAIDSAGVTRFSEPVKHPAKPRKQALTVVTSSESRSFKEIGSPSALIGCEVYTDLECPPCEAFFRDVMPRVISEYVDTGKVRVVRRDFPLPHHQYARLAARYANAAGLIGKYDAAFDRIMSTQSAWKQDGDLETPLEAVLSPREIEKVRKLLKDNPEPEESTMRDRAAGADDHVEQTPAVVVVANGKRYKIPGVVTFSVLKSYLDDVLSQQ